MLVDLVQIYLNLINLPCFLNRSPLVKLNRPQNPSSQRLNVKVFIIYLLNICQARQKKNTFNIEIET